jgi:actin-like protein 6B
LPAEGVPFVRHVSFSDEVSALVVDIGTSTTRAGYAGDDTPRTVFSTTYGYAEQVVQDPNSGAEGKQAKLYVGDHVAEWRPGMHTANPMREGLSKYGLLLPNSSS